ncbi:MAG: nucleoside-triphosphatase [Acidobacteriota bacterium]
MFPKKDLKPKNILLAGLPGVGKTTLILKLAESLRDLRPVGYCTSEIREQGVRKGFEARTLSGSRALLSHVDLRSPHKVGRYGVDVEGFEEFLGAIPFFDPQAGFIVIDEIGKMESLSPEFRELILRILDGDRPVVATIALKGEGLIRQIKQRKDVIMFEVRKDNRDALFSRILETLRSIILNPRPESG